MGKLNHGPKEQAEIIDHCFEGIFASEKEFSNSEKN